ncbi:hypothetical protein HY990_03675 [Candidatus Micrarchaeota archaeon]|nr:hypothetical protein [Candidatus Micrarchaeota archaeon]
MASRRRQTPGHTEAKAPGQDKGNFEALLVAVSSTKTRAQIIEGLRKMGQISDTTIDMLRIPDRLEATSRASPFEMVFSERSEGLPEGALGRIVGHNASEPDLDQYFLAIYGEGNKVYFIVNDPRTGHEPRCAYVGGIYTEEGKLHFDKIIGPSIK